MAQFPTLTTATLFCFGSKAKINVFYFFVVVVEVGRIIIASGGTWLRGTSVYVILTPRGTSPSHLILSLLLLSSGRKEDGPYVQ